MKKRQWKKSLAVALGMMLSVYSPASALLRSHQAFAYTERTATINASSLNVRSGAGTGYGSLGKLSQGASVTVIGETTGTDGKPWYQIRYTGSGGETATGYVLSTYVRFPVSYSHDGDFESQLAAQGFPESYKDSLRQLHAQYPNWTFTAQHTGLDWNTAVENEAVLGRNLVHKNSISSFKSTADGAYNWDTGVWTGFDGVSWVAASEDVLRYYMDPRNFLDPVYVFQFMSQKYDPAVHTREGLEAILKGSFMENKTIAGSASGGGDANSPADGPGGKVSGSITAGSGSTGGAGGSEAPNFSAPGGSQGQEQQAGGNQETDYSAPGAGQAGGGEEVRLQGPGASISRKDAPKVAVSQVLTVGPGGSASSGSTPPSPGGESGPAPAGTENVSYVDAIMKAASASGVNPYVIAAMIIQEQGRNGTGNSIKGNYAGYVNVYNYFNVGAYASDGMGAVERGLWYASQSGSYGRPWNTPEDSILGGAEFYGTNYVSAGQDTLYLKKYNVQGSNMYKHQYMTNVDGAAAEGSIFAEGFSEALKQTALNFKIPVYTNMPASPCVKPVVDGSPNNKLNGLGAEGFNLTPTFYKDTVSYDLIVDHSVSAVTIHASAIDAKAVVSGTGTIQLQAGNNDITVRVKAENGDERDYVIHVVRQTGGPTYNAGLGTGTSSGDSGVMVVGPGMSSGNQGISAGSQGISNNGPGGAGASAAPGDGVLLVGPGE